VATIDIDLATHAMFKHNMNDCAELLFSDTVHRVEWLTPPPHSGRFAAE
jgi:hypothetical protein